MFRTSWRGELCIALRLDSADLMVGPSTHRIPRNTMTWSRQIIMSRPAHPSFDFMTEVQTALVLVVRRDAADLRETMTLIDRKSST